MKELGFFALRQAHERCLGIADATLTGDGGRSLGTDGACATFGDRGVDATAESELCN